MCDEPKRNCKNFTFRCDTCSYTSGNEKEFYLHYKNRHRNEVVHFCRDCGHAFDVTLALIEHIKTECLKIKDRVLQCGVSSCRFKTANPFKFIEHCKTVHRGVSLFPCANCCKIFTMPAFLVKHIQVECATPAKIKKNELKVQPGPSNDGSEQTAKKPLVKFEQKPNAKIELTARDEQKPITKCEVKRDSCATTSNISEFTNNEKKRKNLKPEAKRSKVSKQSNENWKLLNPFLEDDYGSDPDDPIWRPNIADRVKSFKDRRTASRSKIYTEDLESSMDEECKVRDHPKLIDENEDSPETVAETICKNSSEIKESTVTEITENIAKRRKLDSEKEINTVPPPLAIFSPPKRQDWDQWRSNILAHKSFDAFDSLEDKDHLPHFFKCMSYYCKFTSDDKQSFVDHQLSEHWSPAVITQLPCLYCLEKFECGRPLVEHTIEAHGRRIYQCSVCLYRASTQRHVKTHFKSVHKGMATSLLLRGKVFRQNMDNQCSVTKDGVVLSYICAVPDCDYKTKFTDNFVVHNRLCHVNALTYSCSYCQREFYAVEPLMKHLEIHGLGLYQCAYCIFGTEDINEIILHQCLKHADFILEAYSRSDDDSVEVSTQNQEETNSLQLDLSKTSVEPSVDSVSNDVVPATDTQKIKLNADDEVTIPEQETLDTTDHVLDDEECFLISNIKIEAKEPDKKVEEQLTKTKEHTFGITDGLTDDNPNNVKSTLSSSNGISGQDDGGMGKSEFLIKNCTTAVCASNPEPVASTNPVFKTWNEWLLLAVLRNNHKSLETLHSSKERLQNFFACMSYSCIFTTDDTLLFLQHQVQEHASEILPCRYCFKEYEAGKQLTEHTVSVHSSRIYQCSRCLYRACSCAHVKLHFQALHGASESPVYFKCDSIGSVDSSPAPEREEVVLPYVCLVNSCTFKTDLPSEFIVHNQDCHFNVSAYPCNYCKTVLETVEALLRHLTSHGLYNFQCGYCIFGADCINDVYIHQCLNHADYDCKAYIRPLDTHKDGDTGQPSKAQSDSYPKETCIPESRTVSTLNNSDSISHNGKNTATVHSTDRFPCPRCAKVFPSASSFESHLPTHGPTMYICNEHECGFLHHNKESIENHCREKHNVSTDECPPDSNETEQSILNEMPVLQHCMVDSTATGTLSDEGLDSSTSTVPLMPDISGNESSESYYNSPVCKTAIDEEPVGFSWYRKQQPEIDLGRINVVTSHSLRLGIKLSCDNFIKISGMGRKKLVVEVADLKNELMD